MVPGAWPDPWRRGAKRGGENASDEAPPRSSVRTRARALATMVRAVGWPSLLVVGIALPDRLELPRALILASALSLFVFERLEDARARREREDFAAFARALDAEDALASTLFVLSEAPHAAARALGPPPPPPLPRASWRARPNRHAPTKRGVWPAPAARAEMISASDRTTQAVSPLARLPVSQRPTVPESMRTVHVDLLEASRRRDDD